MDVAAWLRGLGLGQYEGAFRDNDIDARVLPGLTAEDLKEIGVASVGHRRLMLQAAAALSTAPPGPLAAPPRSRAERRQLTVMFVDIIGSTALSGRLDPEAMRSVLLAYQNAVAGEIARYRGHIAKFMGDGVLAYFGWPEADEDEAERAARAGVGIVEAVPRLTTPAGDPLAVRVGIATGVVVVGDLIGEGGAQEEAVIGETPNLAARLQEVAGPGAVLVAEGTRRLLGDVFDLRTLGPLRLKGFARPVTGYRVVGERPADSRFEARRSGLLLPMFGREQELGLVLERWRRARAGEGQAVLLVGEPGIGKSRLVRAALDALTGEEHVELRYQCSPQHTGTALWPVAQQLARAAGFTPGQTEASKLDGLEAMLRQAASEVGDVAPLVAALLGINVGGRYPTRELTPQQRRLRTLAALVDHLLGLARRRPALMVLEDAHWADPTTLELVGHTLNGIAGARVLMLLTSRPDNQPGLGGHPHVTRLTLNRLGRGAAEAIVTHLAGGGLPPAVLAAITARTDGVPLFVEELTKAMLEAGPGEGGAIAAVPASLHASLMSRLDRVPGVKAVAQAAACIGREFTYPLLAAASPLPEQEVLAALDRLAAAELIFARGEPPDVAYSFKHALVRDAAYESLLKTQRQQLHARIAETLEERFPETAATEPELLARHYAGAGLAELSVKHWQRAAELAIARSANVETIEHCHQAQAQLRLLQPSPERSRAELEILLAEGEAVRSGNYAAPEAELVYSRACELCEELGDPVRLVHALRGLWAFYYVATRWADAVRVTDRLDKAAQSVRDPVALAVRDYAMGAMELYRGQPAEAARRLRTALRHHGEDDRHAHIRHAGHDTVTLIHVHLMLAQWILGFPEQALDTSAEGLEIARRIAHPFSLATMLCSSVVARVLARDWDAAEALAVEAQDVCTRHGLTACRALAGIMSDAGSVGPEASELTRERLAALHRSGGTFFKSVALGRLALTLCESGDADAAIASAEEAVRVARTDGELCWEAEALRILGEAKWATGAYDVAEVEADFTAAVAIARRQEARSFELRAATSLARLWYGRGRAGGAYDLLAAVYGRYTEGFDRLDLIEARALLGELASTLPADGATARHNRP
ncbi:MAG: adenylate/guanylate cyclase domain-containing protein [Geminicoccaceae bacterium]